MLIVVGGHSRNIGKTSVAAGIIAATREARWIAVKITQHGHGVCSANGEPCDCAAYEHPFAISEETAPGDTDSGRFLEAGAARSLWVRTAAGELGHAIPALKELTGNLILESNSALQFFQPDLYVMVLDFTVTDMKQSTRRYFDRADAFVVLHGEQPMPWDVPTRWIERKPVFRAEPPVWAPEGLIKMVRAIAARSAEPRAAGGRGPSREGR